MFSHDLGRFRLSDRPIGWVLSVQTVRKFSHGLRKICTTSALTSAISRPLKPQSPETRPCAPRRPAGPAKRHAAAEARHRRRRPRAAPLWAVSRAFEGLAAQTGQRIRLRESSNDGWIALALAPEHYDEIAARALAGVVEATGLRLTEDEAVARGEMMG